LALEESLNDDDIIEEVGQINFVMRNHLSPIFEWFTLDYKDGFMGAGDFLLIEK